MKIGSFEERYRCPICLRPFVEDDAYLRHWARHKQADRAPYEKEFDGGRLTMGRASIPVYYQHVSDLVWAMAESGALREDQT